MKPLRIALTKGRLERDTVVMFERIGFDCTAVQRQKVDFAYRRQSI